MAATCEVEETRDVLLDRLLIKKAATGIMPMRVIVSIYRYQIAEMVTRIGQLEEEMENKDDGADKDKDYEEIVLLRAALQKKRGSFQMLRIFHC